MFNYYNKENDTFKCQNAYSFYIGQIGTTQISRMTQDEYL